MRSCMRTFRSTWPGWSARMDALRPSTKLMILALVCGSGRLGVMRNRPFVAGARHAEENVLDRSHLMFHFESEQCSSAEVSMSGTSPQTAAWEGVRRTTSAHFLTLLEFGAPR